MFHGDFSTFLFIVEALIIIPIYFSLKISKTKNEDILLGMSIFYLFFYNVTLNMVRQSIAIAFSTLGITMMISCKKFKKMAILPLVIAIGMHKSALIVIIIFALYHFLKNDDEKKDNKVLIGYIFNVISLLLVFNYPLLIKILYKTNIYSKAVVYGQLFSQKDFSFLNTAMYLFIIISVIINKKSFGKNYTFYKTMLIESFIFLQLGCFIKYSDRISLYFLIPMLLLTLPTLSLELKRRIKKHDLMYVIIIILLFSMYWLFSFGYLNNHETVPYKDRRAKYEISIYNCTSV